MPAEVVSSMKYVLYARKSSESEDKQVASIPSQIDELKRLAATSNLNVIAVLTEEKSAKAPGRPVFTKMVNAIHKGEFGGILCWKLDRLARNPIDGGTISWMLQQGIIHHIQTHQRGYSPQDNTLMMHLEFGMANQFVLDLSTNTRRGMRDRAKRGWFPFKAPPGYLNNKHRLPHLAPIHNDPDRFELIKNLWKTLLTKRCSVESLFHTACELGLKDVNGQRIRRSTFYKIFKNPFYYGYFRYAGTFYEGKHEPMVTKSEFEMVQFILTGRHTAKVQLVDFAFTGLMRCGECGASITAERKIKNQKNGNTHIYDYYRCTKRLKPCSQKPVRVEVLEGQIRELLGSIEIPNSFHVWAMKCLKEEQAAEIRDRDSILESYRRQLDDTNRKLDRLMNMRLSDAISDQEFGLKKQELMNDKHRYESLLADAQKRAETWFNRAEELFNFAETAKKRFETGGLDTKREILVGLGSNLLLFNRTLSAAMPKPLSIVQLVASEVQQHHERLEPTQPQAPQGALEFSYSSNLKWRPQRDSNPCYYRERVMS